MVRYISVAQYQKLTSIPRNKLSVRTKIFCGAILEDAGKILLIKSDSHYPGWDIPGGKLLWSEVILECVHREVLEESGYKIRVQALLGIYQRLTNEDDDDYIRIIFRASLKGKTQKKFKDPEIIKVQWFPIKEILSNRVKVRSPEVIRELAEYNQGKNFPLDVVETYSW